MAKTIQPSFAGGEVSSDIFGRVDIAKYAVALKTCLNWFIRAQGGASTRPGLEFLVPTKFPNKRSRNIKFQFSTSQNYMLEFGDQYMRVLKDGGLVLNASQSITSFSSNAGAVQVNKNAHGYSTGQWVYIVNGGSSNLTGRFFQVGAVAANLFLLVDLYTGQSVPYVAEAIVGATMASVYEIATPYLEADLALIKKTQKFDVMTLCHPSYEPRELKRAGHASWFLDPISFVPAIAAPAGVGVVATNTTTSYGISAITKANPAVVTTATANEFTTGQSIYITGATGMTQVNGQFFTIRVGSTTQFELVGIDSTGYGAYTGGASVRRAKQNYNYVVTSIANTSYEESLQSLPAAVINDLTIANGRNTVSWTAVAGAQKYYVYREINGSGVFGYVGSSLTTTFVDDNIDPETTDTPPGSRNPFTGVGNYPGCVTYHEQRRVFAYTRNQPQTVYATQSGNFKNLNVSAPARDDDAWTFEIGSEESVAIRHLVSLSDLIVLTAGGEFVFKPGANGDTITPNSITVRPESRYGSSDVPPIIAGKSTLFVETSQATDAFDLGYAIRDLTYSFQDDGYAGNDLTILAKHLFRKFKLKEWCYCARPYGIAWGVREDGVVCALTYLREQEVWAWSRHITDGWFESVDQISEGGENIPYFVVRRVINGRTMRFHERMHSRDFNTIDEAFCVDSGLTLNNYVTTINVTLTGGITWMADESLMLTSSAAYFSASDVGKTFKLVTRDADLAFNGFAFVECVGFTDSSHLVVKAVQVIPEAFRNTTIDEWARCSNYVTGLWHLEGQDVSILSDGNVEPSQTVVNGRIDLQYPTAIVHVGLGYDCDLQPLALAGDVSKGSLLGTKVNIGRYFLHVQETRGLLVGPDENGLRAHKQRNYENWNEPTALMSGIIEFLPKGKWSDGSMLIRQRDPLPATLQAVIPDVQIGG